MATLDPKVAALLESGSEWPGTPAFARFSRLRWHDLLCEQSGPTQLSGQGQVPRQSAG